VGGEFIFFKDNNRFEGFGAYTSFSERRLISNIQARNNTF
jgi:hypothetical protein